MKIGQMKESKYVKKEDCGEGGIIVTIANLTNENVALESAEPEHKWVLHFKEAVKPLILNMTNIELCAHACGSEETDDWIGKQIILYNDPNVSYAGKVTGGVRIRKNQQAAAPKAAAPKEYDERNPPPADDSDIPF